MGAFPKNPAYDSYEFYRQCKIRFDSTNKSSVDKANDFIYKYLNNYIMHVLYNKYLPVIMQCEIAELNSEIWIQILKRLPKYNPKLGSPTTFVRYDITHAVCVFVSYKKYHVSAYFADKLEKVDNFRQECEEKNCVCTPELVSKHFGVTVNTASRYMNMLFAAVPYSYDGICDMNKESLFSNCLSQNDPSSTMSLDLNMKLEEITKDLSEKEKLLFKIYTDECPSNIQKFSKENACKFGMTQFEVKNFIGQILKNLKNYCNSKNGYEYY